MSKFVTSHTDGHQSHEGSTRMSRFHGGDNSARMRPCAALLETPSHGEQDVRRQLIEELAQLPRPVRRVAKGEAVYSIGEEDPSLYIVASGRVKTSIITRTGKSCLLDVHPSGDILGEGVLISDQRAETAGAMTDAMLRVVNRDQLMAALSRGRLQEAYVLWLTKRLQQRQEAITALATFDCQQRLAFMLQQLSAKLGRRCGDVTVIDQRLTHEELAAMVGTTRSRIGVFMQNFRRAGMLLPHPGVWLTIHEPTLRQYVEQYL